MNAARDDCDVSKCIKVHDTGISLHVTVMLLFCETTPHSSSILLNIWKKEKGLVKQPSYTKYNHC